MSKSAEEIEPFSISDNDMTIVHRKEKNESKQQLLKKVVVMTVFITIALVVLFEIFGGGQDSRGNMTSPQSPQIRSPSVSDEKEGEIPEEGRLFIFNLANLKEGATGEITIRTRPSWAPKGVEQFENLVDSGFFDGCRFFRVVKNFIVQFGINGDPTVQKQWRGKVITDDPVTESNRRGTVTFATSGPNTRTTQMFINTNTHGNNFLDKQGFSPIGEVIEGMEFVDLINDEYKEKPDQGKIQNKGNIYLEKEFSNLSYIFSTKNSK